MYKILVNDQFNFEITSKADKTFIDGKLFEADMVKLNDRQFHLIYQNQSLNAELIEINHELKTCTVRVNQTNYEMVLTDQFDEMLHRLGMDNLNAAKVSDLKAPMPGMVLKVLVAEGAVVQKGANLLVLEAMKMENIIKSPADLTIKSIKVSPGDKLEKNTVMITFE